LKRKNARATDKELYELRASGLTCRDIAARFTPPLSANSVRGRANRYKRRLAAAAALQADVRKARETAPAPVVEDEIAPLLEHAPLFPLHTITRPPSLDHEAWDDHMSDLRRQNYVTVIHASDMHLPFQDDDALALTYQAMEVVAPDMIVTLSDGFDFAQISHFPHDPDLSSEDILENVRKPWWDLIDGMTKAAPKARLRAILGNHDGRLVRFLHETAPQVRTTVLRAFDDLVRYQGRVMLPDHTSECQIGPLTVMHGNRKTLQKYGARAQVEDRMYQTYVLSGHRHRPDWFMARGPNFAVQSAIGGCLCKVDPHYAKDGAPSTWTQGFAYGVMDMRAKRAWLHNVVYERHDGLLRTTIGARILLQEIDADALAMAGD
jgi:hypothetical protein